MTEGSYYHTDFDVNDASLGFPEPAFIIKPNDILIPSHEAGQHRPSALLLVHVHRNPNHNPSMSEAELEQTAPIQLGQSFTGYLVVQSLNSAAEDAPKNYPFKVNDNSKSQAIEFVVNLEPGLYSTYISEKCDQRGALPRTVSAAQQFKVIQQTPQSSLSSSVSSEMEGVYSSSMSDSDFLSSSQRESFIDYDVISFEEANEDSESVTTDTSSHRDELEIESGRSKKSATVSSSSSTSQQSSAASSSTSSMMASGSMPSHLSSSQVTLRGNAFLSSPTDSCVVPNSGATSSSPYTVSTSSPRLFAIPSHQSSEKGRESTAEIPSPLKDTANQCDMKASVSKKAAQSEAEKFTATMEQSDNDAPALKSKNSVSELSSYNLSLQECLVSRSTLEEKLKQSEASRNTLKEKLEQSEASRNTLKERLEQSETSLEALRNRVNALQDENSLLQEEIRTYNDVAALPSNNNALEEYILLLKANETRYKAQLVELREVCVDLKKELVSSKSCFETVQVKTRKTELEAQELRARLSEATRQNLHLANDLKECRQRLNDSNELCKASSLSVSQLKDTVSTLVRFKEQAEALQVEIASKEATHRQFIEGRESLLRETAASCDRLSAENAILTSNYSLVQKEVGRLSDELAACQKELTSSLDTNAEVRSKNEQLEHQNLLLVTNTNQLKIRFLSAQQDVAAHLESINKCEAEVSALKQEVSNLKTENAALSSAIKEKDASHNALLEEVRSARVDFARIIENLKAENASLKQTVSDRDRTIQVHELYMRSEVKESAAVPALHLRATADLTQRNAELNNELEGKREEHARLNHELGDKREELAKVNHELGGKSAKIDQLQSELAEKNVLIDRLQAVSSSSAIELAEKNAIIDRLQAASSSSAAANALLQETRNCIEKLSNEKMHLKREKAELEARLTDSLGQVQMQAAEISTLKSELAEKSLRFDAMQQNLEDLQKNSLPENVQKVMEVAGIDEDMARAILDSVDGDVNDAINQVLQ